MITIRIICGVLAIGMIVYCLIRLWQGHRKHNVTKKLHSSLDTQIEVVKGKDANSYFHYNNACHKGVIMVSDIEYAYLVANNILQNDCYYCRYVTEEGKSNDDIEVGSCSVWYEGKPILLDSIYNHMVNDLKENHVFITKEEMSETLKDGLTKWLTDLKQEK